MDEEEDVDKVDEDVDKNDSKDVVKADNEANI